MPYITQEERDTLDLTIDKLFKLCQGLRGRINYCCTRLIHLWVIQRMEAIKSLTKKYNIVNDAYGIACCVASEFYDAVVVPYEKLKRKENGPVSCLDAYPDGQPTKFRCVSCGFTFTKPNELTSISWPYQVIKRQCPNCCNEYYEEIT